MPNKSQITRYGSQPEQRYERLNPGAKARRHALAALPVAVLRDYVEELLWQDFREGRLPHTRAIPPLANVMAQAIKHGAYAAGLKAIAALTGVSPRTVIRGSKDVRERRVSGQRGARGYLWRTRGRKGEGVTVWRPGHALVDAITAVRANRKRRRDASLQAKAASDEVQRLTRNSVSRMGSHSHGDTVAHVAAPWAAGREGGGGDGADAVAVKRLTTPAPDIPDTSRCRHGRRWCLECIRAGQLALS